MSRLILLRMRNVADESCREKAHIVCLITFSENRDVYEVMWKNVMESERLQIKI